MVAVTLPAAVHAQKRAPIFYGSIAIGLVAIFDIIGISISGFALLAAATSHDITDPAHYLTLVAVFALLTVFGLRIANVYSRASLVRPSAEFFRLLLVVIGVAGLLGAIVFSLGAYDRILSYRIPEFLTCVTLWLIVTRLAAARIIAVMVARSGLSRNVAIVGSEEQGKRLLAELQRDIEPWNKIVGVFDDRYLRLANQSQQPMAQVRGDIDALIEFSRKNQVDDIIIALPGTAENRLLSILQKLKCIPANIHLAPDMIGFHFLDRTFTQIQGVSMLNVFARPISGWGAVLKAVEDRTLGLLFFLMLAPIMAAVALAIKLESKGPVFFKQKRYGYNNNLIEVYKFRSMYTDKCDANAEKLATRDDPRITRVGRFIRRTSLDELPQLINVLRGEMSIVGPRPHATKAKASGRLYQEVVTEYAVRHKVKPGITGWAQVRGWRGETDTEEKIIKRVEHDLFYMENWSLLFDIEIILRTVWNPGGKNAY